jgi:ketosteroid isomerase-like protein
VTTSARVIDPAQLPEVITTYLTARQARDLDRAVSSYQPDATVTDEGRTYHGHDEIRAWLSRSASEFTYTTEVTGAARLDADHYDVAHHLKGNFPGGQVDLRFRFTLRDGAITRLVIEQYGQGAKAHA